MTTKTPSLAELRRRVKAEQQPVLNEALKTAAMYRLEHQHGQDISILLAEKAGLGKVLARKYGVTESVISKWRSKLGIHVGNPSHYKVKE